MTTMLTVYGKADTTTVNNANAAANVRLTLLELQHDIQSANPLGTLSPSTPLTPYNDELPLTLQGPPSQFITWQYDYTATQIRNFCPGAQGGCLTRQIGSATPVVELTGVNNGAGLPVFTYYDHCAINQVTEAGATASSLVDATTVVQITLSVANLNSAPYGTTTRVNIMNQAPGAGRCG
jgi:hypothetical protein